MKRKKVEENNAKMGIARRASISIEKIV